MSYEIIDDSTPVISSCPKCGNDIKIISIFHYGQIYECKFCGWNLDCRGHS